MKNVGKGDKIIRYVLGVLLVLAGIVLQITTGGLWWLALVGAALVLTAAFSFCLLYLPFRISTKGK